MTSQNVLLIFNSDIMYQPVIYRLAKDFDLVFNILERRYCRGEKAAFSCNCVVKRTSSKRG